MSVRRMIEYSGNEESEVEKPNFKAKVSENRIKNDYDIYKSD